MTKIIQRVLRGGSWGSSSNFLRTSVRSGHEPGFRHVINGFRLVVRIKEKEE